MLCVRPPCSSAGPSNQRLDAGPLQGSRPGGGRHLCPGSWPPSSSGLQGPLDATSLGRLCPQHWQHWPEAMGLDERCLLPLPTSRGWDTWPRRGLEGALA